MSSEKHNEKTAAIDGHPGFFRDLETEVIYCTVYVDGKRRRLSTKTKDLAQALKRAHRLRQEAISRGRKKSLRALVEPSWHAWRELKGAKWAKGTAVDVELKGRHLMSFFADYCVDEVSEETWERFISFMANKHPGMKIAKMQDYFSSFLRFELSRGTIRRLPVLKDPDPEVNAGRSLTDDEIEKILAACTTDKLRLQILMQLRMGMRAGEVLKLAKDRIDFSAGIIRLEASDTKTRRSRSIPIHPEVLTLLRARFERMSGGYIFPSPKYPDQSEHAAGNKKAFATVLKSAGVKCRRHDLRHTCATNMARQEIPPVIACRILGMSMEVYDRIYCRPTEDDLKKFFHGKGGRK